MHSTLLIFIDGVGIGQNDPAVNPFFRNKFKIFSEYFIETPHLKKQKLTTGSSFLFPVDANMGVVGLPQSGTGQVSIFAGINAPKIAGYHFGPYPHSKTVSHLKEKNIFVEFKRRGLNVCFANAYPKIFFDYIKSGRKRLSATSLSCLLSGVKLKTPSDLRKGIALGADINNFRWIDKLNYKLPLIKPQTAANRLLRLASANHFTLYEYFLTDHFGHGRNPEIMEYSLNILDEFLLHILKNLRKDTTLIICSDHGNLEDVSVKTHTRNPALTITSGRNAEELSRKIKKLYHIKKAILDMYE